MLRTVAELQTILRSNPFRKVNPETDVMLFTPSPITIGLQRASGHRLPPARRR